jgi:hypothetical protein
MEIVSPWCLELGFGGARGRWLLPACSTTIKKFTTKAAGVLLLCVLSIVHIIMLTQLINWPKECVDKALFDL